MIYIKKPFANIGDKTPIPFDTVPSGEVSFEQGYTADYQADQTNDPNAKDIERAKFNWFWGAISENQKDWQEKTFPDWISDKGDGTPFAYPSGAIVRQSGVAYISLVEDNVEEPATSANWKLFSEYGGIDFATEAEVQAGTDTAKAVTPAGMKAVFTGTNVNLASNGYQKLPSGLIIQWGTAPQGYNWLVNLPIAFPNAALQAVAVSSTTASNSFAVVNSLTSTKITLSNNNNGGTIRWLAWGF